MRASSSGHAACFLLAGAIALGSPAAWAADPGSIAELSDRLADARGAPHEKKPAPKPVVQPPAANHDALFADLQKSQVWCRVDPFTGLIAVNVLAPVNAGLLARLKPLDVGELHCLGEKLTDDGFDTIAGFQHLQKLNGWMLRVSAANFKKLAALPRLRQLQVLPDGEITGDALQGFPALEEFKFFSADKIADDAFDQLALLPVLKTLGLGGASITDDALRRLSGSKSMIDLSLVGRTYSNDGLRFVGQIESLRDLFILNASIDGDGLRHLKAAKHLERINIYSGPGLNDDALAALSEVSTLENLGVVSDAITDAGIARLNRLVKLRSLNLRSAGITGAGLNSLTDLKKMTALAIHGDKVSRPAFADFVQRCRLSHLDIGTGGGAGFGLNHNGLTPLPPGYREDREILRKLGELGIEYKERSFHGEFEVEIKTIRADDDTVAMLVPLTKVRKLVLGEGHYTAASLDSIAKLTSLRELSLRNVPVSAEHMEMLARLPEIRSLELLGDCGVTDEKLRILKSCKTLRQFALEDRDQIDVAGYELLASFPELSVLRLTGSSLNDPALKEVARSKSVSELSLAGPAFSDEGLRAVSGMANLHTLVLESDKITAAGIALLEPAPQLEKLQLRGCPLLDNDALAAVGKLTTLRSLTLAGSSMSGQGLVHLTGLARLETLILQNASFTGTGLKPLAVLPELSELSVQGAGVCNAVFTDLAQFPRLRTLTVGAGEPTGNPGITDDGLKWIGKPPRLQTIHFIGTGITNQGLAELLKLPRKLQVRLVGSPGVKVPQWSSDDLQL